MSRYLCGGMSGVYGCGGEDFRENLCLNEDDGLLYHGSCMPEDIDMSELEDEMVVFKRRHPNFYAELAREAKEIKDKRKK